MLFEKLLPDARGHRRDIDGLRAIAVLGVILSHAGFGFIPGGFIGVDVFFVLSGYLITGILIRDSDAGRFSLRVFYARRFRRILPALFVVLAATSLMAWGIMPPSDLYDYAISLLATLLFLANIYFLDTTGYFSPEVGLLPLLHMWSLAVEEQFYLIFPLLFLGIWKLARMPGAWLLTLSLAALSFWLALWGIEHEPEKVYFFSPARFWQILAGAMVALYAARRAVAGHGGLSALGLAMIFASFFIYDHSTPFPGFAALLPVGGTALVLAFGASGAGPAGWILTSPLMRLTGLFSFSAYLWHQPVFAFARFQEAGPEESLGHALGLILLVLLLAFLTWLYVEEPFRRGKSLSLPQRGALVTGFVLLTGVAFLSRQSEISMARYGAEDYPLVSVLRDDAIGYQRKGHFGLEGRGFADQTALPKLAIVGDSYARDMLNVLEETGLRGLADIALFPISSLCAPHYLPEKTPETAALHQSRHCKKYDIYQSDKMHETLKEADVIWLISKWQPEEEALILEGISNLLRDYGKPLVVFGTKDFGSVSVAQLLRIPAGARPDYLEPIDPALVAFNERMGLALAAPEAAGALRFVDVMTSLCQKAENGALACPQVDANGWQISPDGTHLSVQGARFAGERLDARYGLRSLFEGAADKTGPETAGLTPPG